MRWLKSAMWKVGIALASLFFFLILMLWIPISAAAYEGTSGSPTPTPTTVQASPTPDTTMTALQKEQLTLQIKQLQNQLQNQNNWFANNSTALIAATATVIVALFGIYQWATNRRDERRKELVAQHKDLRAQAEERFKTAVAALGDKNEATRISGAILLRSFLNKEDEEIYGRYYTQIFDLAVAYLRPTNTSQQSANPSAPLPLNPFRRALIVVFQEVFPLARDRLKGQDTKTDFQPQSLDSSGIVLDGAYLMGADLKQAWMVGTSLRATVLYRAKLTGTNLAGADLAKANLMEAELNSEKTILNRANFTEAHLVKADLSGAYLIETDLSNADLSEANLRGVSLWRATLKKTTLQGATLTDVDLNQADLTDADLHGAILTGASLSGSNLGGADLKYADLNGVILADADLRGADLSNVKHFDTVRSLERTDMHGVTGLSDEQLKACESKGAMIDPLATAVAAQPAVLSPAATQSTDVQATPTQVNTPAPSKDDSNTADTKQSSEVQTKAAPPVQVSTPPSSPDGSKASVSQQSTMSKPHQ